MATRDMADYGPEWLEEVKKRGPMNRAQANIIHNYLTGREVSLDQLFEYAKAHDVTKENLYAALASSRVIRRDEIFCIHLPDQKINLEESDVSDLIPRQQHINAVVRKMLSFQPLTFSDIKFQVKLSYPDVTPAEWKRTRERLNVIVTETTDGSKSWSLPL